MARVVVLGQSGSGKSYYAGDRIIEILEPDNDDEEFEYAFHLDLEDEERGLSEKGNALLKTFYVDADTLRKMVAIRGKTPDYIPEAELEDGPAFALVKWVLYKNKYVRIVPEGLTDDEIRVLAEMVADAAMLAGDTHFSLDEAHTVAKTHVIGDKLSRLVTGGRKRGVEWVFISQRPAKLHEDVLAQSNITIYFQLTSDRDLMKAEDSAEAFSAKRRLPGLGKRKAIVENFDNGSVKVIDTDGIERKYPHHSGDDGKADEKWSDDDAADDLDSETKNGPQPA